MSEPALTPKLIVYAYRRGMFPMADADGTLGWYSPETRAIFPLETFHVPKTLAKTIRQRKFELRANTNFEGVMRGCAGREETWISESIHAAYSALHRLGMAHSIEAWQGGELVGGLYGVALGGAFMGESMFGRATDASKVCLVYLIERLRARGFTLLDSQYPTEHLTRFGQISVPRADYMRQLQKALKQECHFDGPPARPLGL